MIVCKEFPNKIFETKQQMFKELRENKDTLIAQKKMITKQADSVLFKALETNKKQKNKADVDNNQDVNKLGLKLVINTTNVMDSHSDVHLKGIWKKTLKEKKNIYLLQEHQMKFDKIITDEVKASVESMNWADLGSSLKGETEALIFDATIDKRNEFMFNQYAKGYVKNHSVGMRYVKLELALNSESKWDVEEKEIWDKYINEVANKEDAEAQGYFWAVTEAKIIEGSAVPIGSNTITPTLAIENKQADNTSLEVDEPTEVTQKEQLVNFLTHIKV